MDVHPTENVSIGIDPYPHMCVCVCANRLYFEQPNFEISATKSWDSSNDNGDMNLNDDNICRGMTIHKSQLFDGCQVTRVLNGFDPYPSKTCSCFPGC